MMYGIVMKLHVTCYEMPIIIGDAEKPRDFSNKTWHKKYCHIIIQIKMHGWK